MHDNKQMALSSQVVKLWQEQQLGSTAAPVLK
jgi:hypothetical protein